ncbi:hypothetical protein D9615_007084 [Tricholomella constricta]|uniref:Uncharacterized protein n=1 Tax=Tricholomella constricta TaxID=117010 RepID=A0A8H5H7Q6_9AGAR|nr:hypothetical protein D9615_007084 [Tricholomella constricta]
MGILQEIRTGQRDVIRFAASTEFHLTSCEDFVIKLFGLDSSLAVPSLHPAGSVFSHSDDSHDKVYS